MVVLGLVAVGFFSSSGWEAASLLWPFGLLIALVSLSAEPGSRVCRLQ